MTRPSPPPLQSFWMGGFEGADHVNGSGEALDLVQATGHDMRLDADYRRARRLGLRCLRESIGWRLAEPSGGGAWDLGRAVRMAQAAQRQGVQILWTLMHYGLPADLTLLDDALVPRFARFAAEVARVLMPLCAAPRIYTPINEISFLSWAASATGDMGPAGLPHEAREVDGESLVSGYLIKQRLVRAALAGMQAIRAVDPAARFLHVEPVVHVVPRDALDLEQQALAGRIASYQWQALDMLCGRAEPQLGGHEGGLDTLGLNHYHSSQWEVPGERRLAWHLRDPRRKPLSHLLHEVWARYERPVMLAETGHIGVGRAAWLHEVAGEARRALALDVPLQGVCLYPLLDRPDWNETSRWHRSGMWHLPVPGPEPSIPRPRLNRPYARALRAWVGGARPAGPRADDLPTGLIVLLPRPWEGGPAPHAALLDAWACAGPLRLLEPPRPGPGEPVLGRHTLAPGADLLVLHGGPGGWARPPTAQQRALLDEALPADGPRRWIVWLDGWRVDGDALWWRRVDGAGLVLRPDAEHPPGAELARRADVLLPRAWPGMVCRPRKPVPGGYEDEEITRLLAGVGEPRLWLSVGSQGGGTPEEPARQRLARRLRAAAWRQPGLHLVVDAVEPEDGEPRPPNLHWLGTVHDSLHDGLAAAMPAVLRWEGLQAGRVLGPEELADLVARVLQPLRSAAAPAALPLLA